MAHPTVPSVAVDDFGFASWAQAVRAADIDLTARAVSLETASVDQLVGVASSVDKEILLLDGTTGTATERATGTGYVKVASGVYQAPAATVPLATDVSGALPLANLPTNFAQLFQFSVPLTNANLKALPTTGFTLKAAAGAGTLIVPLSAHLFVNTAAGAYTNIDTGATPEDAELYLDIGGNKFGSLVFNDTGTSNTMLSDLLGVASRMFQALYPFFANEDPLYGIYTYPLGVASFLNQPLQLKATNAGLGDYTGGHADNTGLAVGTCLLVTPP